MPSSWYFLKIFLKQRELSFPQRKDVLRKRFFARKSTTIASRTRVYQFRLADLNTVLNEVGDSQRELVTGYLLRTPVVAGGRRYDTTSGKSESGETDVADLYDGTEFIYDFDACVMAIRRVSPFEPTSTISRSLTEILGDVVQEDGEDKVYDVHVGLMRDETFTERTFDKTSDLIEIVIKAVRPNPPGHEDLEDLGDIAEESQSDDIELHAKKIGAGSLAKSVDSFFRRSARILAERGYLSRLQLIFRDRTRFDLNTAKPKIRKAEGVRKVNGRSVDIVNQAAELHTDLSQREGIYRYGNPEEA